MIYLNHRLARLDGQNFGVFVPTASGGISAGAHCYPHDATHALLTIRRFTEGEVLVGAADIDQVLVQQYERDRPVFELARRLDPEIDLPDAARTSGLTPAARKSVCVGDHARFGTFECTPADRYNWHIYEVMKEDFEPTTDEEHTLRAADGRVLIGCSSYGRSLADSAEICREVIRHRHRSTRVVDATIAALKQSEADFIRAAEVVDAHWDEVKDLNLDEQPAPKQPAPKKPTPKKRSPKQSAPKQSASKKSTSEQPASKQSAPKQGRRRRKVGA